MHFQIILRRSIIFLGPMKTYLSHLLRIASILFQGTLSGAGDSNARGNFIMYINFVIFIYILEELGLNYYDYIVIFP